MITSGMKMPAMSVRPVSIPGRSGSRHDQVQQLRELGVLRVLAEQPVVEGRRRAAVEILVLDRHEPLVEQRVALARDLDPVAADARGLSCPSTGRSSVAARRRVDAGDLHCRRRARRTGMASAIRWRLNPLLRVLPGVAQLQQIEDRLDVAEEAVVALARRTRDSHHRARRSTAACSDRARRRWRRLLWRGSRRRRPGCRTEWRCPGCSAERRRGRAGSRRPARLSTSVTE